MTSKTIYWKAYFVFCLLIVALLQSSSPNLSANAQKQDEQNNLLFNAYPVWSPDDHQIAFVSGRSGNRDIWIMDSSGANPVNLTEENLSDDLLPIWSPDGQSIALLSDRTGNLDVWVMNVDSTNPVNLSAFNEGPDRDPKWSPDGQLIAFVSEEINGITSNIWLIRPDGSDPINLTTDDHHLYGSVTWSPDGKILAFTRTVVEDSVTNANEATRDKVRFDGIWMIELGDSGAQLPLLPGLPILQIAWSPAADVIAFSKQDAEPGFNIYSTDVHTPKATKLTSDSPAWNMSPIWSPDGQWIAFESNRDGLTQGRDIWIMNADGSNLKNLTADLHDWNVHPDWPSDGIKIVFETYFGDYTVIGFTGDSDIWVMDADGTNKVNLTNREQ